MNLTWLAPLAALFGLSLPLLIILHMRHSRAKPLPVTTMRFWDEATRHHRQRLAWRRPPRSLLLLLQLLAAALIVLALLRPAIPLPSLPGNTAPRQLVVVLDRSAAMRATDVGPSRFEAAKSRAQSLIAAAAAEEAVALVTLGSEPQTLRSRDAGDRATLLNTLDGLTAGGGRADLNGALPTLRAVLLPERENRVVLLSSGVFAGEPDRVTLAALPATLTWEKIGAAADNLAITTTVTRRSVQNADRTELFARVANYSATPIAARSQIEADGTTVDTRQLMIAANGMVELVWQLPPGTRGARLRVEPTNGRADPLPFDNEAYIVTRDASQGRILLVSDNPGELNRALTAQAGAAVTTVSTQAFNTSQQYDLTVFDRFVPSELPRGGVLLVNPATSQQAASTLLPTTGTTEQAPKVVRLDRESAILSGVDLSGLAFAPTPIYNLPTWATEVVGSEKGPLILAGNRDGREIVAVTFDLAASGLTKKLAFPILIGNIVDRLQTHRVPTDAPLGVGVLMEPVAGTSAMQLREPSGVTRDLELRPSVGGAPTAFTTLDQPGLYAVIERDRNGATILQESFAVNGGDTVSSNLRAVASALPGGVGGIAPPLASNATEPATTTSAAPRPRQLGELWPILLALASLLLLIEWVTGLGSLTPPRRETERVRARPGLVGPDGGTQAR